MGPARARRTNPSPATRTGSAAPRRLDFRYLAAGIRGRKPSRLRSKTGSALGGVPFRRAADRAGAYACAPRQAGFVAVACAQAYGNPSRPPEVPSVDRQAGYADRFGP